MVRDVVAGMATATATVCAGLTLASLGGRFSAALDLLTHFALAFLVVGGAAGALGALVGRARARTMAAACGLTAVLAAGALVAPEFLPPPPTLPHTRATPDSRLKIIQFNALADNRKADAAAAWIIAQDPDIVVLEEGGAVRIRLLASRRFHAVCVECLATVLSRRPPLRDDTPRRFDGWSPMVTIATLADARGTYQVAGVHLGWPTDPARTRREFRNVAHALEGARGSRLILAGDFNAAPWSFLQQRRERQLGLVRRTRGVFTWPAERVSHNRLPAAVAFLPLDYVYAGPAWRTVSVRRGPRLGSDHYPVVVELAPRCGEEKCTETSKP